MTVYYGKIIELVAIEQKNGKTYLQIKLFFMKQAADLFWKIDDDTAENLKRIAEFDGNVKYRLSLQTTLDSIQKQYISFLTKTHLNGSERISFACSADFKNQLNAIKNIQRTEDLGQLPFLSMNLPTLNGQKLNRQHDTRPIKWMTAAMVSVILALLLVLWNHSYFNQTADSHTAIAKAKAETLKVRLAANKPAGASAATLVKEHAAVESKVPVIKLNELVNSSLPKGYVALTFDDGPSKYSAGIIQILKKYKAGGTFFFIGTNVKKHPNYVRYVHSNGYSIGSHSMSHAEMSNLSYEKQTEELTSSTQTIEKITKEKVTLFRPPYELFNQRTKNILHQRHYKMVLWNRDPKDWKTRNAGEIYRSISNTQPSGAIIILHESQAVIDALPKIMKLFQQHHLKVVSLQ